MMQRIMGNLALSGLILVVVGAACPEKHEEPKQVLVSTQAALLTSMKIAPNEIAKFASDDAQHVDTLTVDGPLDAEQLKALAHAIQLHPIDLKSLTLNLEGLSSADVKPFFEKVIATGMLEKLVVESPLNAEETYCGDLQNALIEFNKAPHNEGKSIEVVLKQNPNLHIQHSFSNCYSTKHGLDDKGLKHEFKFQDRDGYVSLPFTAVKVAELQVVNPQVLDIRTDSYFERGLRILKRSPDLKEVRVEEKLSKEQYAELILALEKRASKERLKLSVDLAGSLDSFLLTGFVDQMHNVNVGELVVLNAPSPVTHLIYKDELQKHLYSVAAENPDVEFRVFLPKAVKEAKEFWWSQHNKPNSIYSVKSSKPGEEPIWVKITAKYVPPANRVTEGVDDSHSSF